MLREMSPEPLFGLLTHTHTTQTDTLKTIATIIIGVGKEMPLFCSRLKTSSSHMRVINQNWSATKQRPHPQSVAEISRHSALSGDRIQQCETSSGSRHKDTDQCLVVAISFCRHRSVLVPCEKGSAETTVAEGGRNLVAGLWGHTLREN